MKNWLVAESGLAVRAIDDAVEYGVIVKAFVGILHEVGHGFRGFLFVQRKFDIAHAGLDQGACFCLYGGNSGAEQAGQQCGGEGFVHVKTPVCQMA